MLVTSRTGSLWHTRQWPMAAETLSLELPVPSAERARGERPVGKERRPQNSEGEGEQ